MAQGSKKKTKTKTKTNKQKQKTKQKQKQKKTYSNFYYFAHIMQLLLKMGHQNWKKNVGSQLMSCCSWVQMSSKIREK